MDRRMGGLIALAALALVSAQSLAAAASTPEIHPGITTSYETLTLEDGVKLQVMITKPERASGRLPAIQYVHWLSCDSVAISSNPRDGWSAMLRRIVRESNAIVWRTQKRGVGASEGDCASMDYDTELADHREAYEHLRRRPDVDPQRIVIFGGSIGGTYAPLIAAGENVAGVMIWGAGATTWAERTLNFERKVLELGGTDPKALAREASARFEFLSRYLVKGETPGQIAAADATLGSVWSRISGTSESGQYGRPFAFHHQAQRADWAGAWSRVNAPVLALYGEYDWFESRDATSLIARIANARQPGRGTFIEIPRLNHHFEEYSSLEEAFKETHGKVNPDAAVKVMLEWLRKAFGSSPAGPASAGQAGLSE